MPGWPRNKSESWHPHDGSGFIRTAARDGTVHFPTAPIDSSPVTSADSRIEYPFSTWMDTAKVRGWIQSCNESHSHCQTKHDTLNRPLWLIDVHDKCLKPGNSTQRYLALSYVWGFSQENTPPLETTKGNLVAFQEKGAFDTKAIISMIPSTIKDVFGLVVHLGERYVWIDRFCIVQDSEEKLAQINIMADIYASAYLTIIACGGDAYHGLRGIPGVTIARQRGRDPNLLERPRYRRGPNGFGHMDTALERFGPTSLSHMLQSSCWSKRAWTLQERVFSQRAVYMFDECVVWECHCLIWHEYQRGDTFCATAENNENLLQGVSSRRLQSTPSSRRTEHNVPLSGYIQSMPDEKCLNRFSKHARGLQYSPWPDLSEYFTLVQDYCTRELTFPGDALHAFAGVTKTLSRVFPGGFHYGLPEMFFDVSLLWFRREESRCTRRFALNTQGSTHTLPSWSWMGWQFSDEAVDLNYCMSGYDYVHRSKDLKESPRGLAPPQSIHTIPIIDWCSVSRDGARRQIMSQYPRKEGMDIGDFESLPKGWKRKGEHFMHEYDPLTTFRSPITILDQGPGMQTDRQLDTQVLSFRTTVGEFNVSTWRDQGVLGYRHIPNQDGEQVGILMWDAPKFGDYETKPVTLIAIARGLKTDMEPSWRECDDPLDLGWCTGGETTPEFYFVLAITTLDGISYRLGFGGVQRTVWEAEAVEVLDILLG